MSLYNKESSEWTGYKKSDITVIDKIGERAIKSKSKKKDYFYKNDILLCECKCGNRYKILASSLIGNPVKHCRGCSTRIEAVGKKFNKLTVIGYEYRKIKGSERTNIYWKCICDCGNEYTGRSEGIKRGESAACTECNKINSKNSLHHKDKKRVPMRVHIQNAKSRYSKRGYDFNITEEYMKDLFDKQNGKCSLSNIPISLEDSTASIDRIDSTQGYIIGNVQWVLRSINYMKTTLSQDDFISLCHAVSRNHI